MSPRTLQPLRKDTAAPPRGRTRKYRTRLFSYNQVGEKVGFCCDGEGKNKAYNKVTDSGEFLDVQAVVTFRQIKDAPSTETHGQGLCLV